MTKLTNRQRIKNLEEEIKLLNKSRKIYLDWKKDVENCIKAMSKDIEDIQKRREWKAKGEKALWERQVQQNGEHSENLIKILDLVKKIRRQLREPKPNIHRPKSRRKEDA